MSVDDSVPSVTASGDGEERDVEEEGGQGEEGVAEDDEERGGGGEGGGESVRIGPSQKQQVHLAINLCCSVLTLF